MEDFCISADSEELDSSWKFNGLGELAGDTAYLDVLLSPDLTFCP